MMMQLRVLVVDDNRNFLASVVQFLSGYPELEVVGSASSAREAIGYLELLRPDLVFMDLVMPEMDGLEATRVIKALSDRPKIIVWTLHTDPRYRAAATAVGADGFVAKSDLSKQLLPLIYHIFEQRSEESAQESSSERATHIKQTG